MRIIALAMVCISLLGYSRHRADTGDEAISIVTEGGIGEPGDYGAHELAAAIQTRGVGVNRTSEWSDLTPGAVILAGIPSRSKRLKELAQAGKLAVPGVAEGYAISSAVLDGRRILVLAGTDERGIMYVLLEMARRIAQLASGTPLSPWIETVRPETGKPAVPFRGMIQFLHNSDLERSWYYDPEYWENYFGMLANDRFNSFNLVFAHQSNYLAPPYPFLFDVEEYPQIRVPGLSAADQHRNLETLQMISRLAHRRGIDFVMGIWEQRAWKEGQMSMVDGLSDEALTPYARLAIGKLLRLCPHIAGIQLRVNPESGIEDSRQTRFYRDGVLAGMKDAGRPVLLDLRGWGALPETIAAAVESGLPLRLSMKYWAEFMGMPYQAARMLPSYSYADFLRYPRSSQVSFQVWSLGSHRLFPWGSVEWMRRFVPTTRLGGGVGFETCAPLSQKGFGNAPGEWRIFVSPDREYYRWEFQRYWFYYRLFGRLSYDPAATEDAWMYEFRKRFGERAAPEIFAAYQSASEIIPFLVSYRLSNPNMYIWPEKQMGGLLDFYLDVSPGDETRFASFAEYAAARLRGSLTAKMMPEEAARRLNHMADETERAVARAGAVSGVMENKEFAANRIDFSALALLARYHARKISTAANLELFYETGDESALRFASSQAAAGLESWERLVRLTDGVYFPNMVFGPQDTGHWKDNLVFVRHDLERIREVQTLLNRYGLFDLGLDFGPKVEVRHSAYPPPYVSSYSIERRFRSLDPEMTYSAGRPYGWLDTGNILASPPNRIPYASLEGDNLKNLALPSGVLYRDFLRGKQNSTLVAEFPDGEYRVTAIVTNQPEIANGAFEIRAAREGAEDSHPISYALAETGDKSMDVRAAGGRLAIEFVPAPSGEWLVSGLIITRREPHFAHVPIAAAVPGSRITVAATISAPDGIERAELQLEVDGERKPIVVPLMPDGTRFSAPLEWLQRWEGRAAGYFITATDRHGRPGRLPASGKMMVHIGGGPGSPVIRHDPVLSCEPGQSLRLVFSITGAAPIAAARLYYRHLTQMENYRVVDLSAIGNRYEAMIPADFVTATHDLMYYVEAVGRLGGGAFYPDPDHTAPYVIVRINRPSQIDR